MTDEEIVRHYRQAKNKLDDITVLADLNLVRKEEIVRVLVSNGVNVKWYNPADKRTQRPKKYDRGMVLRLYDDGLNDREIAEKVGVHPSTIAAFRAENHLPPNNPQRGGGRKEIKKVKKLMETQSTAQMTEETKPLNPVLVKIQKILDMVSSEDSAKISGQYLDLMTALLTEEVQRIAGKK